LVITKSGKLAVGLWEIAMSKNMQKKGRAKKRNKKDNKGIVVIVNPRRLDFKGNIMPQSFITRLKYLSTSALVSVTDTASRQFNANGVYDVDPSLGSTSVSGFAELMAFYGRYRVRRAKISVDFINLDARPIICNVGFENQFFTANTKNYPYFSEPNQISRLIAYNLGGAPVRLTMERAMSVIRGDQSVSNDNDYTGTVSTNPTTLIYASMAISDPGAVAITLGAYVRCELTFEVEFYSLKNLNV